MYIPEMFREMKYQIQNVLHAIQLLVVRQGYRIVSNTITGGKCNKCGQKIDGVWN